MTCYYIDHEITFPPPKIFNKMILKNNPKSRGLTAWLWLFRSPGQAKAAMKLSSWPGLAWPIWAQLGLAHGLRPGQAQH
jgi:hypothetical protein